MREIVLTNGMKSQVDDKYYEWLNRFRWDARTDGYNWYAVRGKVMFGIEKKILMHREICDIWGDKQMIDHKDHNGLNNQENNIRVCSMQQNQYNSRKRAKRCSKFKGVSKKGNKWMSRITVEKEAALLAFGTGGKKEEKSIFVQRFYPEIFIPFFFIGLLLMAYILLRLA